MSTSTTRSVALLTVLAYLPMLTAAPGRMPADSKLYLYLDPAGFFGDAATTFDAGQFGGWVPHQHIAYLWPSLPWFATFDALGVPDWIAHRLWVGTIMLTAGLGVRWCARLLGLSASAALAAALVYQLSLYVLPYVSRTSVMLLPWAGLGWVVALTIRATRRAGWRDPALVALVVFTVGAVNATALAMIVPAPALWLVHCVWQRTVTWRTAVVVAVRTAALSLLVSAWWIAALVVQGRFGADVLPYSESLADVSLTATSTETWRGLGYWLFYVRDPYAATTTESMRYLISTPAIIVSFLIPIGALASFAVVRWEHRRFAALLTATGLVLAVGVHPIDDRSPLMRVLTGDGESGLALALRSSTRALPVATLGLALALAMAVDAWSPRTLRIGIRQRTAAATAVGMVAVLNLPALWTGAMVDPALERAQDPPDAWQRGAEALDATGTTGRVLQLPGAEFGAFRWGYTVDQPLPGLTDKPLITRDLLPLGSPGAMDLLYALDDRAQDGVLEPAAIAPVAQLLGADTIWLANDLAFDRFRTARPEVVRDLVMSAPGIGAVRAFGDPILNRPDVPTTDARSLGDARVGSPVVPVEIAEVHDSDGVVRARSHATLLAGSGDGVVDAVAAGLIDPAHTVIHYAADSAPIAAPPPQAVVVTDSNRDRARHWRSSQDTTGFTQDGTGSDGVDGAGDARLPMFEQTVRSAATTAVQVGPVVATARAYGEPYAYTPEHRAFAALDGDPATAWLVGEHDNPIGESITLTHTAPLTSLVLHQPESTARRHIVAIDVNGQPVSLDERSWSPAGQRVEFPVSAGSTKIAITGIDGGTPFTASSVAPVGFSEIEHQLGPTREVVRLPETPSVDRSTPMAFVMTRLRVDATDAWRDDPETRLVRAFDTRDDRTFAPSYTVRLDLRAAEHDLADAFGWPVVASTRLAGWPTHSGVAAFDDDPDTSWITGFGEALGAQLTIADVEAPVTEIAIRQPVAGFSEVLAIRVASGADERRFDLAPDAGGTARLVVDPPLAAGTLRITIDRIEPATTVDRRFGDPIELPAAVSDIAIVGVEPVAMPFERPLVTDCISIGRVDDVTLTASIAIDSIARPDGVVARVEPCDTTIELAAGTHSFEEAIDSSLRDVLQLDRVVLDDGVGAAADRAPASSPDAIVTAFTRRSRTVDVVGCSNGCWLVVGEGHNNAWQATVDGVSLGEPTRVDGGFNGWWISPSSGVVSIDVQWDAQRPVALALGVSFLSALVLLVWLVVQRLRGGSAAAAAPLATSGPAWAIGGVPLPDTRWRLTAAAWVVLPGLLIGPWWALCGLVGAAVAWHSRRADLAALTATACLIGVAGAVVIRERRHAPLPNGAWPSVFASLHGIGMFAVACLCVSVFADGITRDGIEPDDR